MGCYHGHGLIVGCIVAISFRYLAADFLDFDLMSFADVCGFCVMFMLDFGREIAACQDSGTRIRVMTASSTSTPGGGHHVMVEPRCCQDPVTGGSFDPPGVAGWLIHGAIHL